MVRGGGLTNLILFVRPLVPLISTPPPPKGHRTRTTTECSPQGPETGLTPQMGTCWTRGARLHWNCVAMCQRPFKSTHLPPPPPPPAHHIFSCQVDSRFFCPSIAAFARSTRVWSSALSYMFFSSSAVDAPESASFLCCKSFFF